MKRWRASGKVAMLAVLLLAIPAAGAAQELMTNIKVGDRAPDFTLPDHTGKTVKLSDFRGEKNVVLAFYVLAFTAG